MKVELQLNCTGGWVDYTKFTDLTRFTRELSLNKDNDPQKEVTGTIAFFGTAYTLVYGHLINSPNMYSNSVCIRVTDNVCTGNVYLFKIDNKNLKWCDDEGCEMQFDMAGIEPELDCIRNTPISDNTNNVFDQFGPIVHPRFRYCDVVKPTLFFGFIMALAQLVDMILLILVPIIAFLNLLGANINWNNPTGNALSNCTRAWPAPYISTYIYNACNICGMTVNASTMPIFFSTTNPLSPSNPNEYYYATLLTAYAKKGVPVNGTQSYIPNNAPSWTLTRFLSIIKPIWNARWFINGSSIYFHRKDLIGDMIWGTAPTIDFTTQPDKGNLLEGVCFEWNGEGKPKRLYYTWKPDSTDAVGNEVMNRYRGEFIDGTGNPNYTEAIETQIEEISTCGFVLDGNDSAYDIYVGGNTGIFDFAIKTTTDTLQYAKIICHDPTTSAADAKAMKVLYQPYQIFSSFDDDEPNTPGLIAFFCRYMNYPMSFAPDQNGLSLNLWQYHAIDAPTPNKKTNIAFQFKLNYCCQYANLNIYQKVKMKDGSIGEINKVVFDHETRSITVNGNLL
jgi:hypothetical protein